MLNKSFKKQILVIFSDFDNLPVHFCVDESSDFFDSFLICDGLIVNLNDSQYPGPAQKLLCDLSEVIFMHKEKISINDCEQKKIFNCFQSGQIINGEITSIVNCGFAL